MNSHLAIEHLRQHAGIEPLISQIQIPDFTPSGRVYYDLLESIVSQQLSVKVADVIFKRFTALFSDQYPHPEKLLELEIDTLRSVGLSAQKAGYLQNVAKFALEHNLDAIEWHNKSDAEIIALLTQIKGVGTWTVQMLLMFTLGRPDIFPVDDLGIQQAMQRLFKIEEQNPRLLKQQMILHAEPWRPYRTIACRILWRWKDL
ncbi:MAG TPA: DNA-3-methyladenine glycosylase 2 family protein [Saprospirales bacterium]|nr:DNA-3-methyladenine glycosylase 2 family protein [Saprospirales bacterium]